MKKIISAVLVLGLAPLAFAQGMGGGMGMGMTQSFAEIDADASGGISQEELGKVVPEQMLETLFTRWDSDENGEISEEEFNNRQAGGGMGMGG